jgi:putative membrane protein
MSAISASSFRTEQIEINAQLPALISASAVLLLGIGIYSFVHLGPLSRHMGVHIALMNVAAPICAAVVWLAWPAARNLASGNVLWTATIGQMVLLWAWHAPAVQASAMMSPLVQAILQTSLFGSALLFWRSALSSTGARWQSILALLVTGKLVCMLGALLVFSPRLLYPKPPAASLQHAMHHAADWPDLADQHVAGLLMIAACPLSYVLAGIVLAAQTMTHLRRSARPFNHHNASAVR